MRASRHARSTLTVCPMRPVPRCLRRRWRGFHCRRGVSPDPQGRADDRGSWRKRWNRRAAYGRGRRVSSLRSDVGEREPVRPQSSNPLIRLADSPDHVNAFAEDARSLAEVSLSRSGEWGTTTLGRGSFRCDHFFRRQLERLAVDLGKGHLQQASLVDDAGLALALSVLVRPVNTPSWRAASPEDQPCWRVRTVFAPSLRDT